MTPGHRNCGNNKAGKNYWKNKGLEYAEHKLDALAHEYLKMHDIVVELRKEQEGKNVLNNVLTGDNVKFAGSGNKNNASRA